MYRCVPEHEAGSLLRGNAGVGPQSAERELQLWTANVSRRRTCTFKCFTIMSLEEPSTVVFGRARNAASVRLKIFHTHVVSGSLFKTLANFPLSLF